MNEATPSPPSEWSHSTFPCPPFSPSVLHELNSLGLSMKIEDSSMKLQIED